MALVNLRPDAHESSEIPINREETGTLQRAGVASFRNREGTGILHKAGIAGTIRQVFVPYWIFRGPILTFVTARDVQAESLPLKHLLDQAARI